MGWFGSPLSITAHCANRAATANRPSDRGGKPSISNIGLQLRENSLIVDKLTASIITLLAQLSGSRENARDWLSNICRYKAKRLWKSKSRTWRNW